MKSAVPPTAPVVLAGCVSTVIVLVTDNWALVDVISEAPIALTLTL